MKRSYVESTGAALLLSCSLAVAAQPSAAPARGSVTTVASQLRIDAQSMSKALAELASQTGVQLIFSSADVAKNLNAPAVNGRYTLQAALDVLLANSGLAYDVIDSRTIAIRSVADKPSVSGRQNPGDHMRLAAGNEKGKSDGVHEVVDETVQMVVQDKRVKPFEGSNVDLPRTADDVQPYYIFDATTLERSGAVNLESFLKQRLTMNAAGVSNSQNTGGTRSTDPSAGNNTSSINLRGLGSDKTLVLINGRRQTGVATIADTVSQTDLNGIPLHAVERIEVLPSSASGIYGGSAIGGVVNVILKSDYRGGELRVAYDNSWSGQSESRSVAGSYGMSLEGGRTQLMLSGQWSDGQALSLYDRRDIYGKNVEILLRNQPTLLSVVDEPFLGAAPNLINATGTYVSASGGYSYFPEPLVFKTGGALAAGFSTVGTGLSPSASPDELKAALLANAGTYNTELPDSSQFPTGLRRQLGVLPVQRSAFLSFRRKMSSTLDLFVEYGYTRNDSDSVWNPFWMALYIPDSVPTNPFTSGVYLQVPNRFESSNSTGNSTRTMTGGFKLRLPFSWTGQFDYTRSENRYTNSYSDLDNIALGDALTGGSLNLFVDTMQYTPDFSPFVMPRRYEGSAVMDDFSLRGNGPLPSLPWGQPSLTMGLEYRQGGVPARTEIIDNGPWSAITTYFRKRQQTDSAYAEILIPLFAVGATPGLHSLELQLSGRTEKYTVDTGTDSRVDFYKQVPPLSIYSGPTENGEPIFSRASYVSKNHTIGLKYQPLPELTVRGSMATAFLPPSPSQLTVNRAADSFTYIVTDPRNPAHTPRYVPGISGGNPGLTPQNSQSINVGLIWQPRFDALEGLRVNVEYYKIRQFDSIVTPEGQVIVDNESLFPGRVTRDSTGAITLVDFSMINQFSRETDGVDVALDFRAELPRGAVDLRLAATRVFHLRDQFSFSLPAYEAAGYSPAEGGAPRLKANASVNWQYGQLNIGWSASFTASYKQYGAVGGPSSKRNFGGKEHSLFIRGQGGDTVDSQVYHDLFVNYSFAKSGGAGVISQMPRLLDGSRMTIGVRNVFDTVPPFDAYHSGTFFLSPYGDIRLRSFWVNFSKQF